MSARANVVRSLSGNATGTRVTYQPTELFSAAVVLVLTGVMPK